MDLVSLTDIAELLGMTRAGADKLVKRESTFPPPVAVLTGRTRVWKREDVERWIREQEREAEKEAELAQLKERLASLIERRDHALQALERLPQASELDRRKAAKLKREKDTEVTLELAIIEARLRQLGVTDAPDKDPEHR